MTRQIHEVRWQGIPVTVTYDPDWLKIIAHLELKAAQPLPLTETGYRSLFLHAEDVTAAGGAVAVALTLLDNAARQPAWQASQQQRQQLSLF
jgi:hypothetical protein